MASWHNDRTNEVGRGTALFIVIAYIIILTAVLVAAHYGANRAAGAAAAAPADRCPPAGHTTAGDACLPCTPTECRAGQQGPGPPPWGYNAPSICDYADFTRPCLPGRS